MFISLIEYLLTLTLLIGLLVYPRLLNVTCPDFIYILFIISYFIIIHTIIIKKNDADTVSTTYAIFPYIFDIFTPFSFNFYSKFTPF